MSDTTRRQVLAGAAGASAVALLGACGDDTTSEPAASEPAPSPPSDPAAVLAKTSEIPVNGGKIFVEQDVVVTQPTSGEFKAFSARCPHKGCALASVENGTINCRCHGARFGLADGSVQAGPAKRPLDAKEIRVDNDDLSIA